MTRSKIISGAKHSRAYSIIQILLWVWLVGLMALVMIALLAVQSQREKTLNRLQALEVGQAQIADANRALQARPESATASALNDVREAAEHRIDELEQALATRATSDDLIALRMEMDQIKAHQAAIQSSVESRSRATQTKVVKPIEIPIPFRVIGSELRAGQRTVSVAPVSGDLLASQIQVVLPGEAVGQWRLEEIDRNTAVFRAGEQTRRLAIP